MPATPQITLTATLQSFSGVEAGTIANPAKLQIALCNFGLNIPRVIGTSVLAQIQYEALDSGTGISVQLYGNDQITPQTATGTPQTYYAITVLDGEGNTVQCAAYQFTGAAQTIDLSNAIPIPPPAPPTPNPAGNTWAFDIVPAGTINGANATFTLPYAPSPATSLDLFMNGNRLTAGIGYTLLGNTITYNAGYIPMAGDSHICNFLYAAPPAPAGPTWAFDIVPAGTIDGINATFTLPNAPNPATSLSLYKNSNRMTAGIGFTLTGATITYAAAYIPFPGDTHICNYLYS